MWKDIKVIESSNKNVKKIIFTQADAVAEAVLYKYPTYKERTVICCSTQSGCPVGCRFCGTGEFFVRNLTPEEIVDQVQECMEIAYHDENVFPNEMEKCQIMFMSMGEPILNWMALKEALYILHRKFPIAKLLISTIGPNVTYQGISIWNDVLHVAGIIPTIGLQFSIHEAFEEKRDNLIPYTKKLSFERIAAIGETFYMETGRRPFFNYCVHDKNNTEIEVKELVKNFPPEIWECTLSVICEADEGVAAANERQRKLVEDFMQLTLSEGYSTRMFDPAGQDDIGGGCGQLWFVQDWAKNHPELTHKTHGTGKERIHTPT